MGCGSFKGGGIGSKSLGVLSPSESDAPSMATEEPSSGPESEMVGKDSHSDVGGVSGPFGNFFASGTWRFG